MTRLRYNGLSTTLGASLTSSATAVTFGAALTHSGGTNVPTITGSDYIPLSILDATGKLSEIVYLTAYTAGATTGTVTRGQESTTSVAHASGDKVVHAPTVQDVGGLLAAITYNPATQTDLNTTSTTDVDADATNLAVTFIAPPSGNVLVRLSALGEATTQNIGAIWSVREGTTTIQSRYMTTSRVPTTGMDFPGNAAFLITGLTPGSVHTYKWAHRSTSTTGTSRIRTGGTLGPAVMEVHAAP